MEKLYRLLYPMRVCLITSRKDKKDNVMAAAWVCPLSGDPPLFGVSVSGKKLTHELIRGGGGFAINIPNQTLEEATVICGTNSGKDVDKFEKAGLTKEEGVRMPLIKECPVSIECELVDEVEAGDHIFFIGKAVKTTKRFKDKGIYHKGFNEFTSV